MLTLSAANTLLSRDELSDRTGISIQALCGRLATLREGGWVERIEEACVSKAKKSVDGFRLSPSGKAFLRERGAA